MNGNGQSGSRMPGELMLDGVDALAELFLGPGEGETNGSPRRGPEEGLRERDEAGGGAKASIEVVVTGHLPTMASAWVMQYARDRARALGGWVGVVRVRPEGVTIELAGEGRGEEGPRIGAVGGVEAGIRAAASHARAWIVRSEEGEVAGLEAVGAVRLLCGADEASIVGAYREIKAMCGGEGRPVGAKAGVVIVGATEDKAREAARKIAHASRTFLGREVSVEIGSARISGGRAVGVYDGEGVAAAEVVGLIAACAGGSDGAREEPMPPGPKAGCEVEVCIGDPEERTGELQAAGVTRQEEQRAAPFMPGLVGRVAGLIGVEVECPRFAGVELGVDGSGGLHVMVRAERGEVGEAVRVLLGASAWAREHVGVLRKMGGAAGTISGSRAVTMHMFTDDPAGARSILDAEVRVHVLAAVEVEGRVGWYCTPLN